MAWPPTIPPNTRANATSQADVHPQDHNQISDALTEMVTRINTQGRLMAWTGIDNPATGIITAHTAISLAFTLDVASLIEARCQIPVAWGTAFAAGDLAAMNIYIDGAYQSVGHIFAPNIGSGTGVYAVVLPHMKSLAAGAHTVSWQVSRLSGSGTLAVGNIGFGAVTAWPNLAPV